MVVTANAPIDEIAGAMRDALLNWPARVSGLIAADLGTDPHLVQTVLQQHITDPFTEAANRFDPRDISKTHLSGAPASSRCTRRLGKQA